MSGDDAELQQALADFRRGMAAADRGRSEAEHLLATAYPVLRRFRAAEAEAQICRQALQLLLVPNSPLRVVLALTDEPPTANPSLVTGALALASAGRIPEAMAQLVAARRAASSAGDLDETLVIDGYRAAIALRGTPVDAAARQLAERTVAALQARRAEPAPIPRELPDIVQHLRAELDRLDGETATALTRLAEQEATEMANGWGLVAAGTAIRRARLLLGQYRAADALEAAAPAALALDSVRFALPEAARRKHSLPVEIAEGFHTAFAAAAACGNRRVIAELIEVARGNAMPRPRPSTDHADAATALYGLSEGVDPARTVLAPPPLLRTPWGTVACAEHLTRAARYLPGRRSAREVEWHVA